MPSGIPRYVLTFVNSWNLEKGIFVIRTGTLTYDVAAFWSERLYERFVAASISATSYHMYHSRNLARPRRKSAQVKCRWKLPVQQYRKNNFQAAVRGLYVSPRAQQSRLYYAMSTPTAVVYYRCLRLLLLLLLLLCVSVVRGWDGMDLEPRSLIETRMEVSAERC